MAKKVKKKASFMAKKVLKKASFKVMKVMNKASFEAMKVMKAILACSEKVKTWVQGYSQFGNLFMATKPDELSFRRVQTDSLVGSQPDR